MNLYDIEVELLSIYNDLTEGDGELTEELDERLKIAEADFRDKMLNYSKYVRVLEGDISAAEAEVERIITYSNIKVNLVNRLKNAMLQAIKLFGTKDPKKEIWRLEVGTFKLGTRSSTSTEILDEEAIEDRFKEISIGKLSLEDKVKILDVLGKSEEDVKITQTIPLTPIKKAIEAGEVVNGAALKTNYSLSLK